MRRDSTTQLRDVLYPQIDKKVDEEMTKQLTTEEGKG